MTTAPEFPRHGRRRSLRRTALGTTASAAGLLLAGAANAQSAVPAPSGTPVAAVAPQDQPTDGAQIAPEIVVRGLRRSLANAVEAKRSAPQIMDTISAEDIGKLPDQNIAESLQRITGVQISRSVGEGSAIAIRGLPQNRYEVDGATLTGNGTGRDVSFSSIPSELFGSIEVIKSPTANMVEGALGGTIRLNTVKPLDLKGLTISGQARADYSDFRHSWDPEFSAFVADKWQTGIGEIGALIDVAYDRRTLRNDNLEVLSWDRVALGDLNGDGKVVGGEKVDGVVTGALTPDEVWRPRQIRGVTQLQDRKRLGAVATLQWRPSSTLDMRLTGSYTRFKYNLDYRLLRLDVGSGLADTLAYTRADDGTLTAATIDNANVLTNNFYTPENQTNYTAQFAANWHPNDRVTVSTLLNLARGRDDVPLVLYPTLTGAQKTELSYDFAAGNDLPTVSLPNFDFNDLSSYKYNTVVPQTRNVHNDEDAARIDAKLDIDSDFFRTFEVGFRYAKRFFSQHNNNNSTISTRYQGMSVPDVAAIFPDGAYDSSLGTGNDFMAGLSGDLPRGWAGYSADFLQNDTDQFLDLTGLSLPIPDDLGAWYDVTEHTLAGYVQADVGGSLASIPFTGNVGIRVVKTREASGAYLPASGGLAYSVAYNNYVDALPSANLTFNLTDKLLLRLAAAKVMARPAASQLSNATQVNNGYQTANSGNPYLEPFRATQYDVSLEWYFAPGSLFSLAGFYKDVAAFISTEIVDVTIHNPEYPGHDDFRLTRPTNGDNGKIKGFEVGFQHSFVELPGPLSGLGVQANYTFVDSTTPNVDPFSGGRLPIEQLSKNSYNLVGYFEKYGFQARLAYNWRSKYLSGTAAGAPIFSAAVGQLDASASYDLTKNVTLTFDAINLNNAREHTYQTSSVRLLHFGENDRRFEFGVRARF